ncbi:MAG: hypothetical protein K5839_05910 [Treponemataceae bacterium]|nr:hypothetical protein [Treponemataceae bacterium]
MSEQIEEKDRKKRQSLISAYKERYIIAPSDAADYAEANRSKLVIVATLLLIFGLTNLIGLTIVNFSNLPAKRFQLIYFLIFSILSAIFLTISVKVKNCKKEKAYLYKNIPLYLTYYLMEFIALFSFFILNHPFNGFITFLLITSISMVFFSIEPLLFLIGEVYTFAAMAPGLYKAFEFTGLLDSILICLVLFILSLYKRATEKRHILFLKKQKYSLEVKTFGNFTLLFNNQVIKFSRTKSQELLAYLVLKNGSSVNTKELISVLWGDYADSARYGNSFRNLVVDIRQKFKELDIQKFFISEYNSFRINPDVVKCDYYDFLAGDEKAGNAFTGEFMSQYSWAEDTAAYLEAKLTK